MIYIGRYRLCALRAMYLFIALGLSLMLLPQLTEQVGQLSDSYTVINSFLLAILLLSVVGFFHPIAMLPVLLFEFIWKSLWLLLFAFPMWLSGRLDEYTSETAFACLVGVVLTLLVIPWRYVLLSYRFDLTRLFLSKQPED